MGCGCGGAVPVNTRRNIAAQQAPTQTGGATKASPYVWNGPKRPAKQQA